MNLPITAEGLRLEAPGDLALYLDEMGESHRCLNPEIFAQQHSFAIRPEQQLISVYRESDETWIGGLSLSCRSAVRAHWEVGYWIRPAYSAQGLSSKAARILIRQAFVELRPHKVSLYCDSRNEASIRVAHKLGFVLEGHWDQSANSVEHRRLAFALFDRRDLKAENDDV